MVRKSLKIKGVVQGVGFRPFLFRLAQEHGLTGYARNTSEGVEAEVEGPAPAVDRFVRRIPREKPSASRIERITVRVRPTEGSNSFSIRESRTSRGATMVSPDLAVCPDCRREFYDPGDRRHLYPFINCTNCGPRYSIILATPYDRKRTAMKGFRMCPDCRREFKDVRDRRFHAQPDCCPLCGPRFTLRSIDGRKVPAPDPVMAAADLLTRGRIIAVKGIAGFHICCDARNEAAVKRLRKLKVRPAKPFAVMAGLKEAKKIAFPTAEETAALCDPAAPIVLLRKKGRELRGVAPADPYVGVMLPYAPVHYRLLERVPCLLMTSANLKDEPLAVDDREVRGKLGSLVSHYLTHDRRIVNRCDDSVGYVRPGSGFSIIRRARGIAPTPVPLPFSVRATLGVGPLLKNTFTLAESRTAYVSPHIGDLEDRPTLDFFRSASARYRRWFRIEPELIAHDLHPDYMSTRLARSLPGRKIAVQHHRAHIAACMAENRVRGGVIGIAFDGTGWGDDGRIWGGEFFCGGYRGLRRVGRLEYLPLAGGEASIKKPCRIAAAYLYRLLGGSAAPPVRCGRAEAKAIHRMVEREYNLAYTSSMGRLFDCVAGLLGIMPEITYEAEAAIRLEHLARRGINAFYPCAVDEIDGVFVVRIAGMMKAVLADLGRIDPGAISAKFHNGVVRLSLDICLRLRRIYGVDQVCLSGGVFQNRYLSQLMIRELVRAGFKVRTHRLLPDNDGCVSYGQVVLANAERSSGKD